MDILLKIYETENPWKISKDAEQWTNAQKEQKRNWKILKRSVRLLTPEKYSEDFERLTLGSLCDQGVFAFNQPSVFNWAMFNLSDTCYLLFGCLHKYNNGKVNDSQSILVAVNFKWRGVCGGFSSGTGSTILFHIVTQTLACIPGVLCLMQKYLWGWFSVWLPPQQISKHYYQTQVHLGSNLWVRMSLANTLYWCDISR